MEIANKFGNDKQNPDMLSDILHCPFVCMVTLERMEDEYYSSVHFQFWKLI